MTSSTDPDEIRAEIERTRAALSSDVDALADTANPRNIANRQVDKVKEAAGTLKDKIMGPADDPDDTGAVGEARAAVGDRAAAVGDAVSEAPARVTDKARGNPLAAGLIAFGAGLLVSSLIPSTRTEQKAVSGLQQNLEPLKTKATEAAKEVAANLRGPAQEAAASVKETAADAAATIKEEGQSAKADVQDQADASKARVTEQANT